MKTSFATGLACFILLACADTIPDGGAFISGVITSRAPMLLGVQTSTGVRTDSVPQMLVTGSGPGSCNGGARILFSARTPIRFRNGTPADTGTLTIGTAVSVWNTGLVLESCPPIASAAVVVLKNLSR